MKAIFGIYSLLHSSVSHHIDDGFSFPFPGGHEAASSLPQKERTTICLLLVLRIEAAHSSDCRQNHFVDGGTRIDHYMGEWMWKSNIKQT